MAGAKPGVHMVQLRPISVPENLTKGNKFIMFNDNSTIGIPVTMKVDDKGYILYWKDQSKEMDFLDISHVKDARTGSQVKVPKDHKLKESLMIGQSDIPLEDKMVTVVHGTDLVNIEYLHFVCPTQDLAQEWTDELLKYSTNLLALNSSALTYWEKLFVRFSLVLNNEGKVSMKNITKNITNNRDDRKKVEKALESVGFHAGKTDAINPQKFTFENFFNFYRHLVGRTEVDKIFDELGAKKKPYLTTQQFRDFLNKQQRDPRLNEVLYPLYTQAQADALIHRYENKSGMAQKGHLSQEGFLKFLMSEDNTLIPPEKLDINEDMDQPLSHYFINSSHNTYLTGHQLTGKSSVEMYHQVLLSGCRCVELDCWDGKDSDTEPIITHGYTMCTEVLFKDVIEAIAQSAFKTSDFPVILSFENHCSPKQQAKMANYCRTIFGDMLLINPLDSNPLKQDVPLPSPNQLKRKIIIKNKKKHFHREKVSKKNNAQNMSKRVRPRVQAGVMAADSLAKTKLTEVDEEAEMTNAKTDTEQQEPPPNSPPVEQISVPPPEPETKSPNRKVLEKNMSITSEGPDVTEPLKEGTDVYESESDSTDSDYDDDTVPEEEKDKDKRKKKPKKQLTEEEKKRIQRMNKEKGTAGKEASAAMEMSLLVNYIQPVHFHSFDASEKRKRSYEITSFVETQATAFLKEFPVDFVNYNKRQMSRIYPKGTRVDSSNFMPQVFWNAGCQLVALNFQTLDLAMQVNLGIFEYNGKTGYILKPDFMRRKDRHFDPFAESTVDGIIAGTVSVKIISGQFLSDKKVNTYVEVDMYGLPTDTIRKKFRSRIVANNGLNPVYDEEPFVFKKVVMPNLATLRIAVYEDQNKSIIGHRILPVSGLRPGYRHIPLRNECNQPLLMPTLFVHIVVKDYIPDTLAAYADALSNPIAYLANVLEKHSQQLEILTEDFEEKDKKNDKEPGLEESISQADQQNENTMSVSQTQSDAADNNEPELVEHVYIGVDRQNSITSHSTNVSMNPNSDSGSQSKPSYSRAETQTHIPVSKQESSQSANSQGSSGSSTTASMTRLPSGMLGQENGSATASVIQPNKLTDISIITPTPLTELKAMKPCLKAIGRRDKELEIAERKHEKARESMEEQHQLVLGKLISGQTKSRISMEKHHSKVLKKLAKEGTNIEQKQNQLKGELQELLIIQDLKHREMKAIHARNLMKLCKAYCQTVLDIKTKHHDQIYDSLEKLMESNHSTHSKGLDEIHDKEVVDLKKRMDTQSREHMKVLNKKHKDKQELARIKREAQQKHVQTAVNERQKLKDLLDKRQSDLETKLAEIKNEFAKEREDELASYKTNYYNCIEKLEEEFGSQIGDEEVNESNSTSNLNNGEVVKGSVVTTIEVNIAERDTNFYDGPAVYDGTEEEEQEEESSGGNKSTFVYDGPAVYDGTEETESSGVKKSTFVYDGPAVYDGTEETETSEVKKSTFVYDGPPVYDGTEESESSGVKKSTFVYDGPPIYDGTEESEVKKSTFVYDGPPVYDGTDESESSGVKKSTFVYDGPPVYDGAEEDESSGVYDGSEQHKEKVNSREQLTTM